MPIFSPAAALTLVLASLAPLPTAEMVPFLKLITSSAGVPGQIACKDLDAALVLKKSGLSPTAQSPVALATGVSQTKAYVADGKLVVCGDATLFKEGASIAVFKEGGKLVMVIDRKNLASSGVALSDTIYKIAKVL